MKHKLLGSQTEELVKDEIRNAIYGSEIENKEEVVNDFFVELINIVEDHGYEWDTISGIIYGDEDSDETELNEFINDYFDKLIKRF